MSRRRAPLPLKVAHLTTVDMSLALLLAPQLDAVRARGGEPLGVSAPGPFVPALEARGVRHVAMRSSTRQSNLRADLRAARELWRVLRTERPTVLHTHNPKPGVYGRIVGRLAGVPIVVNTVHGLYATPDDPWPKRAVVYALEWFAQRWSDAELVQNPEDLAVLRRLPFAPKRRIQLLGNGIDVDRFAAPDPGARARLRAEWGVHPGEVLVGTVGRLVREKGHAELIEAVRGLTDVRLVVVGPSDPDKADGLAPTLIRDAEAAGVRFLGFRDDMADVYSAFDVFVLASYREGFPRAAMEAAAAGLPLVVTDIRGGRQVVDDGVSGRLVAVRSAPALRAAISELATDADQRRRFGGESARIARERFDERAVVRRVMACYAEIADRRGLQLEPDPRD